ncbi:uncharacterized protein LOC134215675 [Armigeres subalbatus]|uniref:uncharacterized protein LOC134215675 n=1 Tax=Armigeres subalbatus TaxID=124917 RepID=UPI002ED1969D
MNCKLVVLSALLCIVAADVSEIQSHPKGRVVLKSVHLRPAAHKHKLKVREIDGDADAQLFETIIIEDDAKVEQELAPLQLVVAPIEESIQPIAFQLHESHPDFQGPYHYEKPVIENDYLAPKPDGDYLPPHGPRDSSDGVAKRSIKLKLRARH